MDCGALAVNDRYAHKMPTIDDVLRANAGRVPTREALVFEDRRLTWAELDREVDRLAGALCERGLAKGDRCALMAGNSDRFVLTFYAALRVGAVVVPVNIRLAPPEVAYVLRDAGCQVLVFDPALRATVEALADHELSEHLRSVVSLGPCDSHDDLLELAAAADQSAAHSVREIDDAMILYTSGTTGHPKGVLHDHRRLLWTGMSQLPTCGLRDGDRYLHVAPLYHGAGTTFITAMTLVGGTQIVLPGFDPAAVLDAFERERITTFLGVPTMYQFLLREPGLGDRDLSSWRVGVFGAAPMPASAVQQMLEALPGVGLIQQCGQTEAGPGGIYCTPAQVRERPDASGRQAMPFYEARVVTHGDRDVGPGEVGELILRGAGVMKGYWNKPQETAEALRAGWLRTGDLARVGEDGYITLVDRLKDLIITGGRNVYSVEVENAIAAHPDVMDCAVVGQPDPDWGESIVAVIALRDGASVTLEDLRTHARALIADYKIPHQLVVGPIPRNASGKILKHEVRAALIAPENDR
jgi:acyl-CoA synthetase (AMP-forming)/AMP-acid ligase II